MLAPARPGLDLPRMIHGQAVDRGPADACQALETQTVCGPSEVTGPRLSTRMEVRHRDFRGRVQAGFKSQFPQMTGIATQCQIAESSPSTATFRHDVV